MAFKRMDLIHSIVDTIKDYREGEIAPIDANHISKWIGQFDYLDQLTILAEMDAILKRFYVSRTEVKENLHTLLLWGIIDGRSIMPNLSSAQTPEMKEKLTRTFLQNVRRELDCVQFLKIQLRGESQGALLGIMNEILEEWYDTSLADCGKQSPTTYVYLDDGIYTGSRLRYDLTESDDTSEGRDAVAWISRSAPVGCKLIVCTLVSHLAGYVYARKHINQAADVKQISVGYFPAKIIYNLRDYNVRERSDKFECLWPDRSTADGNDPDAGWYVKRTLWWCNKNGWSKSSLTRSADTPAEETLFSSPAARNIVESAFFRAGARILKPSHQPGESRRPLGWEKLESWGFGTFFVTYRNIANNCPMVLWSRAAGWYPLFPRKTNNESGEE